jgi:hypothetical protein
MTNPDMLSGTRKAQDMTEPEQSGPSAINYLLLQLIRAYKEQKQQALAYRSLLIAREPTIGSEKMWNALNAVQSLVGNKFQEAEAALLDGNSPLQVLRDFLNPQS